MPVDLARASEVFLTNSLRRVVPVLAVAGVRAGLFGPQGLCFQAARDVLAAAERGQEFRAGGRKPS